MGIRLLGLVAVIAVPVALGGCGSASRDTVAHNDGAHLQRLAADGSVYAGSGDFAKEPWACVRDLHTGLVWEVKRDGPGLHGKDNTYSWHDTDELVHKGDPGVVDGGACSGSRCDTQGLVAAVNAERLCGFDDWRVPDQREIATLNDPERAAPGPTVAVDYFPTLLPEQYWTRDTHLYYPGAWSWNFRYGHNQVDWKRLPKRVVLVRGEAKVALARPED